MTPAAGESVTEGTVLEWRVQVGDFIKRDDTIVEISTDKVDVELPAPASGTVVEILAEEGDTVTVGQVIARMTPADGDAPAAAAEPAGSDGAAGNGGNGAAATAAVDDARVSPVAARVAAAEGVDLTNVSGSGPGGRILKADVLGADGNGATVTEPARGGRTLLKGGAAMLARYMDESRSIPTATSFRTIAVTVLEGRRGELKAAGKRVSFTHLIAYAIAQAATEMPVMAHHFSETDGKPYRVDDGQVNLGLAVDVEKRDGSRTLMVPVIRGADALSFADFLAAYDALVEKARTNTLTADDLAGANVTLTNPGGIGTIASVPRLMSGQGTIVATGSIAYPVGLGAIGAQIGAEKAMTMTSTYDHRVIQGAESGRFLALIEQRLQGEDGFYESVFESLGVQLSASVPTIAPTSP
ncbi:MAG TPA: 2-oxo acid dehydrogenase subunit E2, partial [Solirubrobacteraceae bacterium]|nr:2-oxo acid dehydrogenase subunit E2 [Solirubrobacteraceae bacterium]